MLNNMFEVLIGATFIMVLFEFIWWIGVAILLKKLIKKGEEE